MADLTARPLFQRILFHDESRVRQLALQIIGIATAPPPSRPAELAALSRDELEARVADLERKLYSGISDGDPAFIAALAHIVGLHAATIDASEGRDDFDGKIEDFVEKARAVYRRGRDHWRPTLVDQRGRRVV